MNTTTAEVGRAMVYAGVIILVCVLLAMWVARR